MGNKKLSTLADELGTIKAAIANLKQQETDLKDILKESGQSVIDGEVFRVSVSSSSTKRISKPAFDAMCAKHAISNRDYNRCFKTSQSTTVKVSARKVDA